MISIGAALTPETAGTFGILAALPILYLVLEWAIRIGMVPFLVKKHSTSESMAWLIIIFFQPVIGGIIYLVLGRDLLSRSRSERHADAIEFVETPDRLDKQRRYAIPLEQVEERYRDLVTLAENIGKMPMLTGNEGRLIGETAWFADELVEAIDRAEHHVHMLYYIWMDDTIGNRLADAVLRAAKRGVACRVLVDQVGSKRMLETLAPRMRAEGVELRSALPVHILRNKFARIDVRNHRKLTIIDGRTAFTGSHNACNADYDGSKYAPWIDLTARLRGPIVHQLQMIFCEDWASETGAIPEGPDVFPEPEEAGPIAIQTVPSGPGHRNDAFRDIIIAAINEAEHRVVMTTPYFIPDDPTLLALTLRARAGLRVELIVPERCNHPLIRAAAPAFYEVAHEAGVRVLLHSPGLLHAKTLTVDDSISILGSGNFDRRSFRLNYELNMLSVGKRVTEELLTYQEKYIAQARALSQQDLDERSRFTRLMHNTAKLFSPVL